MKAIVSFLLALYSIGSYAFPIVHAFESDEPKHEVVLADNGSTGERMLASDDLGGCADFIQNLDSDRAWIFGKEIVYGPAVAKGCRSDFQPFRNWGHLRTNGKFSRKDVPRTHHPPYVGIVKIQT